MEDSSQIKEILKQWIEFDDEQRRLRNEIKALNERKKENSELILKFMRDNSVDDFHLEGNGLGTLSRSTRTTRPPLKRNVIKTQLLLQFSDQPQRIAEVLRNIEGVAEGADNTSVTGTTRELLVRKLPMKL
jgi:seryl-tRNA synthetase